MYELIKTIEYPGMPEVPIGTLFVKDKDCGHYISIGQPSRKKDTHIPGPLDLPVQEQAPAKPFVFIVSTVENNPEWFKKIDLGTQILAVMEKYWKDYNFKVDPTPLWREIMDLLHNHHIL